jgi:hypothetical protein
MTVLTTASGTLSDGGRERVLAVLAGLSGRDRLTHRLEYPRAFK